jgi:hypothetical protein
MRRVRGIIDVRPPPALVDAGDWVVAPVTARRAAVGGDATLGYTTDFGSTDVTTPIDVVAARAPLERVVETGADGWRAAVRVPPDAPPSHPWVRWWLRVAIRDADGGQAEQRVLLPGVRNVPTAAAHARVDRPPQVLRRSGREADLRLDLADRVVRVGGTIRGEVTLSCPGPEPLSYKRIAIVLAQTRGADRDGRGQTLATFPAPPGNVLHPGQHVRHSFELAVPPDAEPSCDPCWDGALEHREPRIGGAGHHAGPIPRDAWRNARDRLLVAELERGGIRRGDATGTLLFLYNGGEPEFAPGWYPDPSRTAPLRYWDGSAWTSHVSAGAHGSA